MGVAWKVRWGGRRGSPGGGETGPAGRFVGRLVGTLFFGVFFGLGVAFLLMVGREAWRSGETYGWSERSCEILHSQVVRAGGDDPYRPEVGFRTLDAGETVTGHQIQRRVFSDGSHGAAQARLAPYPVGATVPCFVSPAREAVLERGPLWIGLWALLPVIFVAIGGVGLVACWWPEKKDRFGRPVPQALGERAAKAGSGRALLIFGSMFATLGGAAFWFLGVVPLANVHAAQSWHRHACRVEHSSVVSHQGDDGTTYSVDVLYRWDRGRGTERSSRYSFFGGSSSGYDGKAEIVKAHPVGSEVSCWVHPERANEAVLERGLTAHAFIVLVPLAFLLAGGAMIVAGRRKATRRERMTSQAQRGQTPFPADDPVFDVLPDFEISPGPVALETQSSRWGRVLAITFMAIFWNGIVSVFVHEAWKSWERGRPDWFLMLFLVPFVLIGIAFVFGIFHSFLALANARPRLTASSRTPRLGDTLELQWRFSGRVRQLGRVRILLEGKEHATYRVGTDTRTATENFLEHQIVDVPAPACFAGGHATVTIPSDSMHSFESGHNKLTWELTLVGEIQRWPDVKETYPLVVLPRASDDHKPEGR